MFSLKRNLLLTEFKSGVPGHELIISQSTEPSNAILSAYFNQLIEKYSTIEVKRILEIYPADSSPLGPELRKKNYIVRSIPFSHNIKAITENEAGYHYIIGEAFQFPDIQEQDFDAIIVTHGLLGQITEIKSISTFLAHVRGLLTPRGLLLTEIWHVHGVNKATLTEKGHKDWELITPKEQVTIIRLSTSKLNAFTNILEVAMKYIIENKGEDNGLQNYNETHLYKLYSLPEIKLTLRGAKFTYKTFFEMNGIEQPKKDSFRLLVIAEKKEADYQYNLRL